MSGIRFVLLIMICAGINTTCVSQDYSQRLDKIYELSSVTDQVSSLRKLIDGDTYSSDSDTLAMLLIDLSSILFRNNISISEAIDALDEALTHVTLEFDKNLWLESWYYKGYWYRKWDKYDEAKKSLQQVLEVSIDNPFEWDATIQLGKTYKDRGDFSLALDTYNKALTLAGNDKNKLATTFEVISFVYLIMENEDGARRAIPWLEKLIDLLQTMPDEEHFTASMIYNLGTAYLTLGELSMAEKKFSKAETIIKNCCEDDSFISLLMESRASILTEKGNYNEALELYLSALDLYEESFDLTRSDGLGSSYHHIANVYHIMGDFEKALEYMENAISYRLAGIDNQIGRAELTIERLRSNGEKHYLIEELLTLSSILYDQSKEEEQVELLDEAIVVLEHCEKLVDFMRFEVVEESSKLFWRERTSTVYDQLVKFYFETGRIEEAFSASEKSKYMLTGEHLSIKNLPDSELAQLTLINDYERLKKKIDKFSIQQTDLKSKGETEMADSIRHLLVDLKNEEDDLLGVIKKQYLSIYQNYFTFHISTINETQKDLLKLGQTLIEYHITEEDTYVFVVNKDSHHAFLLGSSAELNELIKLHRRVILTDDRMSKDSLDRLYEVSARLYDYLLRPVEGYLADEVYIVPDGGLSLLPFATLVIDIERSGKNKPLSDWSFLLDELNVAYLYSASLESKNELFYKDDKPVDHNLIAIRPEYVNVFDTDNEDNIGVNRREYTELKGAAEEVSFLKSATHGFFLEGKKATEGAVKEILSTPQSIVHIASHAVVNSVNSALSKIVLHSSSVDDGMLYSYEISKMNIDADLVVLSACNTGVGEVLKGEGISSLGHSFVRAGSKNIVSSLWSVEDKSTSSLIQQFYTSIFMGTNINQSLRYGQLSFKMDKPDVYHHPFYWGGFISIGQGEIDEIAKSSSSHLSSLPLALLCVFIAFLFFIGVWFVLTARNQIKQFRGFAPHVNIFGDNL